MGEVLQLKLELCQTCKKIETYRKTDDKPLCIICEMPTKKIQELIVK